MLNQQQQHADSVFTQFISSPEQHELAIIGHAGTGKTYLVKHLLSSLQNKCKAISMLSGNIITYEPKLTALTHKAARELRKSTGEEVNTVHSFFGLSVYKDYSTGQTKLKKSKNTTVHENILLFIDESSMISDEMLKLIRSCTLNCKIVYILDNRQLLDIYASNMCAVESEVSNRVYLTDIMRQAKDNPIIQIADQLRSSIDAQQLKLVLPTDTDKVVFCNGKEFQEQINKHFSPEAYDPLNSRILAYSNDRTQEYNSYVRSLHTPHQAPFKGEILYTNSTVINPSNNMLVYPNDYEVTVSDVDETMHHGVECWQVVLDNKFTTYLAKNRKEVDNLIKLARKDKDYALMFKLIETFPDLRPNYASTVHKSQGSTFENVFIDLDNIIRCKRMDTLLRLLYVAFTRTSNKVYLFGSLD